MSKPTIKITRKNGNFAIKTSGGVTLNDRTVIDANGVLGAYPIGSIYLSVNSTSPASLFGGTWEKIKDKFLLSSGDTYTNGATGGEATHTLTIVEMPSHNHSTENVIIQGGKANISGGNNAWYPGSLASTTGASGGSQPHNNMPPYLVVNIWKRVS